MPDHHLLDQQADHRQRERREHERQPEPAALPLDEHDRVGAQQEHLAMGHVDHVHQPEEDDEAQRHQQQRQHEVGGVEGDDQHRGHRQGSYTVR